MVQDILTPNPKTTINKTGELEHPVVLNATDRSALRKIAVLK
jgi:hypothetical protein